MEKIVQRQVGAQSHEPSFLPLVPREAEMLTLLVILVVCFLFFGPTSALNTRDSAESREKGKRQGTAESYRLSTKGFCEGLDPVQLQILTKGSGRNATASLLYGWMNEDISVRGCGYTQRGGR